MKSIKKTDIIETDLIYDCVLRSSGIYNDDLRCVSEKDVLSCACFDNELGIIIVFEI